MYKLYRSKKNWRLHQHINIGGIIHNHCIALHRHYYRIYGKSLSYYDLKRHITKLKKLPQYAFWRILGSQAIQNIVERIDKAYKRFVNNLRDRKAGKTKQFVGPPSFRKVRKAKSFTLTQAGWRLLGSNRLKIGRHVYKFSKSREIEDEVKTVTIKRDALGDVYAYFSVVQDDETPHRIMTGQSVGFDFGLSMFLTGSDGAEIRAPQPLKAAMARLKRASRNHSTKRKGSANRERARKTLARVHRAVANRRNAWHWHLARELCLKYDVIFLEDLNLTGMVKLWGRKMTDLAHGNFLHILEYVASKLGTVIHKMNRWFPSTQLCHICGALNHELGLRDRIWTCHCSATHKRDFNAAINIHREGASSLEGERIRLTSVRSAC